MPPRKQINVDQLVNDYNAGQEIHELATKLGVSDETIRSRLLARDDVQWRRWIRHRASEPSAESP